MQPACPDPRIDPIRRRAILHRAVWSEHPLVTEERSRIIKRLFLSGHDGFLQGKRRIIRRLAKRRDAEIDRLLVLTMLAHGEEVGSGVRNAKAAHAD